MEEKLIFPQDFITVTGVTRPPSSALLTPSHFTVSPVSPPAAPGTVGPNRTQSADSWMSLPLHRDNQRLTHTQHTLNTPYTHTNTQQTPNTFHTLTDSQHTHITERVRGEREEVERLKEELRERERTVSRQCAEREKLTSELNQYKEELDQNRNELQQVCESHSAEVSSLTRSNTHLHDTLTSVTQEVTSLTQRLEEVTSERERLQEQLSTQSSVIEEQLDTLQKLRSYIGSHTEPEEQHIHVQKLQKEKEALCVSIELLKVRVQAANDILTLQERELGEQSDPLYKDSRAGQLLTVWREKVFTLLVQLRSRDLQLHTNKSQLHNTVCELQQDVQKLQNQISVLQHNLEDKTAQLELHNIHTQELQEQVRRAEEESEKLREEKEKSEKSLTLITDTAHRMSVCVDGCEDQMEAAQFQMTALTQRLNFATKRLSTVHVLLLRKEALRKAQQATKPPEPPTARSCIERLQAEVALLSSERETLTLELKRTPELIQNALSDLQHKLEKEVGLLKQAVSQSRAELEECELSRAAAHTQCEEQEGTIAELRAEAHHIEQHWQSVVQEKVLEVDSVCDKKIREMESQVNTARREHTKAVVTLRQVERTAVRAREQEREAEKARTEHAQKHITHLQTKLKHKDKDLNILLAVVQQQGLMSEYKRMRRAAIHSSTDVQDQHQQQHKDQQQHPDKQEGSVLSVLGEVRSLSSALIHSSEEEEDEDDEERQGDSDTHTHSM